ncbi:YybS family protein [Oceanobacillus senegalensis]|uniref:YybS family protein n=1 Tax=Oceanobacillus senegalensis TaxID=1936063 RepID=UPI000A30787C|nr:DUF2232 domain-containing protein [Oceanobacillus senegalensis]
MNQSKMLKDGIVLLIIFMILLFITISIPVLPMISIFLLPLPFVIFAARYNWKSSLLMLMVAMVITAMISVFLIIIPAVMGFAGIMIGSAIYKGLSSYETLARGTFGFIIGLLSLFVISQSIFQVSWTEDLQRGVSESMEMSSSVLDEFGLESQAQLEEFEEMMQQQINYLIDIFPVFLVVSALILAFITQWISYKILNQLEKMDLVFPPFRTLRIPSVFLWIYLVVLILSFVEPNTGSALYVVIQNVLVMVSILLTIQGFSFIFFYSHHKHLSKAIPILSIILAILLPFLISLIRIIGIIDIGFKMRDRLIQNK